ncbi:MAG: hypothetical protein HY884_07870 [Deltaproteobacteria bacterium]|nr:hypothetical protein [Deltaproteobacteria bacterium]
MTDKMTDKTLEEKLAKAFGLEHLLGDLAEFDRVFMDKIRSEKFLSKMSQSEEEAALKGAALNYIKKRAGGYGKA